MDIKNNDIVYWCGYDNSHKPTVKWGMVDEVFSDCVYVDFLSPKETRLVDGKPIDDFVSEDKFRKLPKGWTYNTELFKITYSSESDEIYEFLFKGKINNPVFIKEAYDKGYLVKDSTLFWGNIESEITKEGYRIRKTYPMWTHHSSYTTVQHHKLYKTYEEAQNEVDNIIKELERQASLSDYDWSLEQIDKDIKRHCKFNGLSDVVEKEYHNWFVNMDNVEDIETRMFNGQLQWKYWKNKKWANIEL